MAKFKKRGHKGKIIHVLIIAGHEEYPLLSSYSAILGIFTQ